MAEQWHGWLWKYDRWNRVCAGATLAACARALSRAADAQHVRDPDTVLTTCGGAPVGAPPGRVTDRQKKG